MASKINADVGPFICPPAHPDIVFPHVRRYGGYIHSACRNIIQHLARNQPDLASMPAYLSVFSLFAYCTVYQVQLNEPSGGNNDMSIELAIAEGLLREVYSFYPHLFDRLRQPDSGSLNWRNALKHFEADGTSRSLPPGSSVQLDLPMDFEGMPFQVEPDWLSFFSINAAFGEGDIMAAFANE